MIKVDPLTDTAELDVVTLSGQTERVKLRRLSLKEMLEAVKLIAEDKIEELVAMSSGRPVEWLDTLTDESTAEVFKACTDVVFRRAMKIAEGHLVMARLLTPLVIEYVGLAEKSKTLGSSSSPAPAPSASAEATGIESLTSLPSG